MGTERFKEDAEPAPAEPEELWAENTGESAEEAVATEDAGEEADEEPAPADEAAAAAGKTSN